RAEPCTMRTRGPPRLRPETFRFRDRLRPGVEPICREDTVDVAHLVAGADLQPQVVIHRVPVALVHAADGVERFPREERTWLRNAVPNLELQAVIERNGRNLAQHVPFLVDLAPAAVNERAARLSHPLDGGRDRTR